MKQFQIIEAFHDATSSLCNMFELIGVIPSSDVNYQLMISPCARLVRELCDRIAADLFTDEEKDARYHLYFHEHRNMAADPESESLSEDDIDCRAVASMEQDARTLNIAACRILSEMQDAIDKFGLMAYEP